MKNIVLLFVVINSFFLATVVMAVEEEPNVDMSEPERCLSLRFINKMKVIDDHNILFYARGKKLYQNTLPKKCIGLNSDSIISYNADMGKLCRLDIITIQDRFGDRFFPSSRCTLGSFEQIPILEKLIEED